MTETQFKPGKEIFINGMWFDIVNVAGNGSIQVKPQSTPIWIVGGVQYYLHKYDGLRYTLRPLEGRG